VHVPTKQQVLTALGGGTDYHTAAACLGIHPGLAYLIATGMPADGSDVPTPEELERAGVLATSTQHLANPPASEPDAAEVVHAWLRRRAQSDPQMLAAVRARTATPSPVQGESTDVLDVLTRQHDQVTSLVKQLDTIPGRSKGGTPAQASERESIVDMITKALAAHETSEEQHLWPRVREVLPDGDDWAIGGLEQEQQATETLAALAKGDPQTEEYDQLVEKLMSQLHQHVAYEDRLFLRLGEALDEHERSRLGERILAAQRTAPTRAHAPREPGPAITVAAKPADPLDKARPATGRPADREGHPDTGSKG
jgi:Hemerythrin HHE cation binding domain